MHLTICIKKISNVLILAWNKKKYIINKHKRFTNNKGKFILPFNKLIKILKRKKKNFLIKIFLISYSKIKFLLQIIIFLPTSLY